VVEVLGDEPQIHWILRKEGGEGKGEIILEILLIEL